MNSPYTEETVIYIPWHPDGDSAAGMYDYGGMKAFNFVFTSPEKATAFINKARSLGIPGLGDVKKVISSTVGEFFRWQEEGKIVGELVIDNPPEVLDHPVFSRSADLQN